MIFFFVSSRSRHTRWPRDWSSDVCSSDLWINAGDSGEPPKITWTLPEGITAGAMQFPIPERLPLGPLMDFGYEEEVAFPVTISAAPTVKHGPVHLDAQISWLVCAQVCLPGKAHLGIDLTVQP